MDLHLISYYVGIFVVFASHIYLLTMSNNAVSSDMMQMHSYANIMAASLIAYYFMNKEGFIKF
jgi:hypothetical protein